MTGTSTIEREVVLTVTPVATGSAEGMTHSVWNRGVYIISLLLQLVWTLRRVL